MTMWRILALQLNVAKIGSNLRQMHLLEKFGGFLGTAGGKHKCILNSNPKAVTNSLNSFVNQRLRSGVSGPTQAILFTYNCAQDEKAKKKSIKISDATKCRDRLSMPTFSCKSVLKIKIQIVNGILTGKISLQHHDDHILYCDVHIPNEALEIIRSGKDSSFKDVSHGSTNNDSILTKI